MDRPGDALEERRGVRAELARDQDVPVIYTHPRGAPRVHAALAAFDEDLSGPVLWSNHRVPLAADATALSFLRRRDMGVPILTEGTSETLRVGEKACHSRNRTRIRLVATPEELAAFQVRTAVAVARLDEALGPEDADFKRLAINELTKDRSPTPYDSTDLLPRLLAAENPITALGQAFATSYSEAATRACAMIVDEAVVHLFRWGGDPAVQQFLDGLEVRTQE